MVEENIFDHILYEFQMYVFTYYQVYVSVESKRQVYMNLLLDSHMLHLRNVANFFDVKKQRKNYIHISDCLKNGTELMIETDKLRKIYSNNSWLAFKHGKLVKWHKVKWTYS